MGFGKLKVLLLTFLIMLVTIVQNATAAVDFSALTDLINATFTVLDVIVTNSSTLISIVVLFGTLGLVGIIIYSFIGKMLTKISGSVGGKGRV